MSDRQWGFRFQKTACIQCHACETACKAWRPAEPGIRRRRVLNLWQGQYPSITASSLSLACQHCVDPACAAACPTGAITKRLSDGAVLVDLETCIGCTVCLTACPFGVPQFGTDGLMVKCDLCIDDALTAGLAQPPCAMTCPTGALERQRMSVEEKQQAEQAILAGLTVAND
jgi:anaerobic dimethyl sulfoxide reductase subunit B